MEFYVRNTFAEINESAKEEGFLNNLENIYHIEHYDFRSLDLRNDDPVYK